MRHLALLLLLPALAFAQAPAPRIDACTGAVIPPGTPTGYDFDLTKEPPGCLDMRPGGLRVNVHGMLEWQYCKDPQTGRYYIQRQVTTKADILASPAMLADAVAAGWPREITPQERMRLARKYAHLVKPLGHPENAAVWCPFRQEMEAGLPSGSVATGWIVAKNGALSTRPTFPVVNGRRSARSNGSVPIGVPCEMTGAISEPPLTFGYPDGAPANSVALCVRG